MPNKDYLEEYEIPTAKMCISGIMDKLSAINHEVLTNPKPHKSYLNEKLTYIQWDVKCLINLCQQEEE